MFVSRLIPTTAVVTALAAAGVAGAADAPVVSQQRSVTGAALVTVPGTGIRKGEWMGSKAVLVLRRITLEGDQRVRVTLRAPQGKRIRGLATAEGERIAFRALDRHYAGRRHATVQALLPGRHRDDGEVTGTIYALAR